MPSFYVTIKADVKGGVFVVEISEEEIVNLDNLADGLSEVRKYKSKHQKGEPKEKHASEKNNSSKEKLKGGVIAFFVLSLPKEDAEAFANAIGF